jgi:hypothetical protein
VYLTGILRALIGIKYLWVWVFFQSVIEHTHHQLAIFLYHLQLIFGQHIGSRLSTVAVFWKHVADILHPSSVVFWQHGGSKIYLFDIL